MKESKPYSIFLAVLTALLVVSGSIAVPLLCRPFYYAHIEGLSLCAKTGLSKTQIRLAYDEMMDFCLGLRPDFSVGELAWSQSGMEHFVDVRTLFRLDLWILLLSVIILLAAFWYGRKKSIRPALWNGHGPGFWGAVGLAVCFGLVGGLAALNFQQAFVVFHSLFFPGKTNWIFNWRTDPIILLLPETFFRNCALLILVLIFVWCTVLISSDLWAGKKREEHHKKAEAR